MSPAAETQSGKAWIPEKNMCPRNTCDPQANEMVLEAMKKKLLQRSRWHQSEPFCVMDLGDVYDEYQRWSGLLPNVKPFYGWTLFLLFQVHLG